MNKIVSNQFFRVVVVIALYGVPLLIFMSSIMYDLSMSSLMRQALVYWVYSLYLQAIIGLVFMLYGKFARSNLNRNAYFIFGLYLFLFPIAIGIAFGSLNN